MGAEQYVCRACGYNMVGYYPRHCPFCGAGREFIITSEECSRRFHIKGTEVTSDITRLNSNPALGLEHAAYRIDTANSIYWIDCPSSFDSDIPSMDVIMFTHHHFLGASNQYRDHFSAEVSIHKDDSAFELCRGFTFDNTFSEDFSESGIDAFHLDGHTPGFTCYIYRDILFICDYVFLKRGDMRFNPFGPETETTVGGNRLRDIVSERKISTVCGYNYVSKYSEWIKAFNRLLKKQKST